MHLREVITAAVRKHRPEIVITNNFRDTWGGASLNQADHIATGKATLDAVRDAGNRWVFRSQIESDGLQPWGGVREVWVAGSPNATHAVDTSATFDAGVASLEAHRAYIDGLGWEHFDPEEFLEGGARATGSRLGVPMATSFEVFRMGWGDWRSREQAPAQWSSRHRPVRPDPVCRSSSSGVAWPDWRRPLDWPSNDSRSCCSRRRTGSAAPGLRASWARSRSTTRPR